MRNEDQSKQDIVIWHVFIQWAASKGVLNVWLNNFLRDDEAIDADVARGNPLSHLAQSSSYGWIPSTGSAYSIALTDITGNTTFRHEWKVINRKLTTTIMEGL